MINLMRRKLAKIPVPLAGLALGVASLGAVTTGMNPVIGNSLVLVASLLLLLFLSKVLLHVSSFIEDLKHPVFGSMLPTFSMGAMIVASFLGKLNYQAGKALWLAAIGLHIALLIHFLIQTCRPFRFINVVPSYFIPPVGLVVACISGQGFKAPQLCTAIFYFGVVSCLLLLCLVLIRLSKGALPDAKKPTLAILAAPCSLCLAGCLSLAEPPSELFLYLLIPLSILLTLSVYILLFGLLKMPFNPGCSAYTFPLVISAAAMLKLAEHLVQNEMGWSGSIHRLGMIEYWIAAGMVLVVAVGYLRRIVTNNEL